MMVYVTEVKCMKHKRSKVKNGYTVKYRVAGDNICGYLCSAHRDRLVKQTSDFRPVLLIVEARWKYDYGGQYVKTIENAYW